MLPTPSDQGSESRKTGLNAQAQYPFGRHAVVALSGGRRTGKIPINMPDASYVIHSSSTQCFYESMVTMNIAMGDLGLLIESLRSSTV
jgi:hypothetical protein